MPRLGPARVPREVAGDLPFVSDPRGLGWAPAVWECGVKCGLSLTESRVEVFNTWG